MAKRKKYKPSKRSGAKRSTSSPRRRRRVGAMALNATSPLVKYGAILAGYLFGDKILAPLKKMIPATVDGKIVGLAEGGLGYMLALKKGGKKSMITVVAGGLLLGDGVKTMMASFGIGGIGPYGRVNVVAGGPYGGLQVVNGRRRVGYSPNNSLNGYSPSRSINKVMGSAYPGGSGITNSGGGSMME